MSTWVVGDLQGCFDEFQKLLRLIDFQPGRDQLWLAGDLVSRGPKSLECLRYAHSLGDQAITVLGNHDLHLLAVARVPTLRSRADPTLTDTLAAPDAPLLLDWLQSRSLLHHDIGLSWTLVHAGLAPQWTLSTALTLAREIEARLQSVKGAQLLAEMYGDEPTSWRDDLSGMARWRFGINAFTRLRYVTTEGKLALRAKGAPGSQPSGQLPWFTHPDRRSRHERIVFGHWSTLGQITWPEHRAWGLDSGCVWGGTLTALCLESGDLVSTPCPSYQPIGE